MYETYPEQDNQGKKPVNDEWDSLGTSEKTSSNTETTDQRLEAAKQKAKRYQKFGKVAMAMAAMEAHSEAAKSGEAHETGEKMEEKQAEAFLTQLDDAFGELGKSLINQIEYNIVNHKQINTRDALKHELESGTAIPELDIRFDKDGKPWVSHSQRAGARFFFSKPIHKLSSKEVEKIGQRLSLEDALKMIKEYNEDGDHRVVLEIKELGPTDEGRKQLLEHVGRLLEKTGLSKTAIFAPLSPDLLQSIHESFPDNSKILNGGIAPVISCEIEKSLEDSDKGEHEIPFKLPNVELFISSSAKAPRHHDGYGKQTGYLWLRLPKEAIKTLSKMNEGGNIGAASLTLVNKMANVLEKFSPKAASALRKKYADKVHGLGMRVQTAISKSKPVESVKETTESMGDDTVFYSDASPGDWAGQLPEKKKPE